MLIIDNINKTVKEDLQAGIQKGSKMSVAAACFSIYAYQELKKQLEGIEELRFIFTSPTFITEKASKAQREFYIPRISRERSLYGTEFEVKLRNELTQKAIAKECADWIRHKVVFKSNVTQEQMMGFMTVDESTYMPINGFTTVDLGCERGNNAYYPVQKTESFENANYFLKLFEQLWNDKKKLQEVTRDMDMVCCVNCSVPFFPWVLLRIIAAHSRIKQESVMDLWQSIRLHLVILRQSADIFQNTWKL